MTEEGQTLMAQEMPHRQRTNSEMSTLSEFSDVLDSSMNSVDGAGLSRKSSYGGFIYFYNLPLTNED